MQLYPGRGIKLRKVAASTGNAVDAPDNFTIPNNGYSETIGAGDCDNVNFEFVFGAAATGDVLIEQCDAYNAANGGTTFDTVTAAAEFAKSWSSGGPITGFFRIKNTSGQNVTVYCQKQIRR